MTTLNDSVLEIVKDFVTNDVLFTALDISNKVKSTMPYVKHKEVRDIVRSLWDSEISPSNYDRTPIPVTLPNGSVVDALLYHPLSASWDLDNLYSAQQRAQVAVKPSANTATTIPTTVQTLSGTLTKDTDGTVTVTAVPVTPSIPVVPVTVNPRDLWLQMWQKQPSLFPRK